MMSSLILGLFTRSGQAGPRGDRGGGWGKPVSRRQVRDRRKSGYRHFARKFFAQSC